MAKRRSEKVLLAKTLCLLTLTKMPSRPCRMVLPITCAPGAFQIETPLPASAVRRSSRPTISLFSTSEPAAPCR
jgi:hypothetical protein